MPYAERSSKARKLDRFTGETKVGNVVGPPGGRYFRRPKVKVEPKQKQPKENRRARVYA